MDDKLPAGSLLKVEIEVRLPVEATEAEIEKWLYFTLAESGSFPSDHPLIHHHPELFGAFGLQWQATGYTGRVEKTETRREGDKTYYSVRHFRDRITS